MGQLDAAAYVRVSTDQQDVENQKADVEQLCQARGWRLQWFEDQALSGMRADRPAYQAMMEAARRGRVKRVVVWKLDRVGRKAMQLVQDVDNLASWGCDFISVQDPAFDTTTAMGRFTVQIMAGLAQLERDTTSARTKATARTKRVRAASVGQRAKWGRGAMATPEQVAKVQELGGRTPRPSIRTIAAATGVPKSTVHEILQAKPAVVA